MKKYILVRLLYMVIAIALIVSITFLLLQFMPGSPFNDLQLTPEQRVLLDEKYGLNDPIPVKYARYVSNLFHGELGTSFIFNNQDVSDMIAARMSSSVRVGLQALVCGSVIGVLLGIVAALKRNSFWDHLTTIIAVIGVSIPAFVIGSLMQYYFGVKMAILPVIYDKGNAVSTIMPTIALAFSVIATTAKYMRNELVDIINSDYILFARSKGLTGSEVIIKHAVRNALIPVVTILGPMTISLITGSTVVERIFSVPGLGNLLVTSIQNNDYFVILGEGLVFSLMFLSVVLVVDILYGLIDPRIRLAGGNHNE
ncbi:ABC transporter permease [Lawsonibacter sp. LCP25S3_G6]|uniref:ABC transporter permease n=1 Tax=unclassified Lawsonibacter TaxID=2617946 RepID=UPI003F9B870D